MAGGVDLESQVGSAGLDIDPPTRRASLDGETLELTAMEFDLLWVLVKHQERVVTYEEIASLLWGSTEFGEKRALEVQISRSRAKLGESGAHPHLIHTIRDVGYRFMVVPDRRLLASLEWDAGFTLVRADLHDAGLMDAEPDAVLGTRFMAPCDQWLGYSHEELESQVHTMFDQGIRFLSGPCSWQYSDGRSVSMEHITKLMGTEEHLSGLATDFYSPAHSA